MQIAIEGMDGVGKTSIAQYISDNYNFKFVEKPLHYFYNDGKEKNYNDLMTAANRVYDIDDSFVRAWFFSLGNVYCARMFENQNVVIDRHLVSNYFWNGNEKSKEIFKCIIEYCGKPDLTILLYATPKTRMERLKKRNLNDFDLDDDEKKVDGFEKMINFIRDFDLPYVIINTENKSLEDVKQEIDSIMNKVNRNEKPLIKMK